MNVEAQQETRSFQAEVKDLLNLMAHSLYSNKEIFLRELISNASDAENKLREESLSDHAVFEDDHELKIYVEADKKAGVVKVRDNGIGMTRAEIIDNLGTIAKSGTREFLSKLSADKNKDSQLIGQFGVGFYSVFVVADKVVVRSRRAGMKSDQGVEWSSDGQGDYSISNIDIPARGTEIILHLKKDAEEFLEDHRLQNIIRKYSDHILFPIVMKKEVEVHEKDSDSKEKKTEITEEVVNQATALWTLSKNEITDEQYNEFYKHVSHDFENPLQWAHNRVEGKLEYICLLYIPSRAPFDLFNREHQRGLKLYVRRVFIMDDAEQLLPQYLRFVRGIVDSNDLPLNVSREILQNNAVIEQIKNGCIKRILDMLEKLAKQDPEKYSQFWKQFGNVIKEGPGEDYSNKDRIAKLIRFASSHTNSEEQSVSLDDYVSRMKPDQDKIYYITAETFNACKNSPHLEIFKKKGIEVLYLFDRIDEWLVAHLTEFEGKHLQSVMKGDLDNIEADEETKEKTEKLEKDYENMIKQMKEVLGEKVKDIRLSHRLTDSPACLVSDDNDMSGYLQRMLAQAGQNIMNTRPIMEINPEHQFIKNLYSEQNEALFSSWSHLLFDQSLLAEGGQLEDPATFVKRMNELLLK